MRQKWESLSFLWFPHSHFSEEGNEKWEERREKERQRNEEGRGRKWERGNNRKEIDSLLPLIFALLWENSACREASCSLAPQTHCTCTIIACSSTKTWPFMLCHDSHNGKDYYTVEYSSLASTKQYSICHGKDSQFHVAEVSWVLLQNSRSTRPC